MKLKIRHMFPLFALILTLTATSVQAHTGHGTSSLFEGLVHPFGLDHLLAMVAVGLWSAFSLPAGKVWMGPATFMGALIVSALVGATGFSVPFLEYLIAASVVLFGVLLMFAFKRLPNLSGLTFIAAAAALHGLAHGTESPVAGSGAFSQLTQITPFILYAGGFLLTTAALHGAGFFVGRALLKQFSQRTQVLAGGIGLSLSGAGMVLLSQA